MIQEIFIKNSPVFKEITLSLSDGFNVFSGASGVGKSVLMESILALFGHKESNASVIEAHFSVALNLESWGIESNEETTLSILKKDKTRYFINAQNISKNRVLEITSSFVKYLGSRHADLQEDYLRSLLDLFVMQQQKDFKERLVRHGEMYEQFCVLDKQYQEIIHKEQQIEELKEFAAFEIQKISAVSPKVGEYDALMEKKRWLSRGDKIKNSSIKVHDFIEQGSSAVQFLQLLDRDSSFLEEALMELSHIVDAEQEKLEELLEINIEELLERISLLSDIRKRYGGEAEALEYLKKKQDELEHYENLSSTKEEIQKKLLLAQQALKESAQILHADRLKFLPSFEKAFNEYLKTLHLRDTVFELISTKESALGSDLVSFKLQQTDLKNVSAGEFSRIRLALLALEVSLKEKVGVLILDEVDANLSGEESEGVAKILKKLSQSYQILAISHQPHMPILCDRHFLVYKETRDTTESKVKPLNKEQQIKEVARMISGAEITPEALEFAKKRFKEN